MSHLFNGAKKARVALAAVMVVSVMCGGAFSFAAESDYEKIDIGSGSKNTKIYKDGRLASEIIGRTRFIYVGDFKYVENLEEREAGISVLQDAAEMARRGDIIIVEGDKTYDTGYFTLTNGVQLYGGYDAYGIRDIKNNPTVLENCNIEVKEATRPTAIIGFTIFGCKRGDAASYSITIFSAPGAASNLVISNNIFDTKDNNVLTYAISSYKKSNYTLTNNVFNTSFGLMIYSNGIVTAWENTFNCTTAIDVYGETTVDLTRNTFVKGRIHLYNEKAKRIVSAAE